MKKIERLIAIVMILLQKETVSASEFSKLFGVTPRTIQRDMDSLLYANIPIFAKHGPSGGYSLMESYKLDKRLFNQKDIENMVIAVSGFDELIMDPEIQLTLEKIKGMGIHPPFIQLEFSFYEWIGRSELQQEIVQIRHAIAHHYLLEFDYIDKNGKDSMRCIEPYKLLYRERFWYIQGYDVNKNIFRIFKITRMSNIIKKALFSSRIEYEKLPDIQKISHTDSDNLKIKLLISPSIRDQFVERFGITCINRHDHNKYIATIFLPDNQYSYQYLLGFGNKIEIIEPQSYIINFINFIKNTLNVYKIT